MSTEDVPRDFRESDKIDAEALKTLIRAAVTLNKSKAKS